MDGVRVVPAVPGRVEAVPERLARAEGLLVRRERQVRAVDEGGGAHVERPPAGLGDRERAVLLVVPRGVRRERDDEGDHDHQGLREAGAPGGRREEQEQHGDGDGRLADDPDQGGRPEHEAGDGGGPQSRGAPPREGGDAQHQQEAEQHVAEHGVLEHQLQRVEEHGQRGEGRHPRRDTPAPQEHVGQEPGQEPEHELGRGHQLHRPRRPGQHAEVHAVADGPVGGGEEVVDEAQVRRSVAHQEGRREGHHQEDADDGREREGDHERALGAPQAAQLLGPAHVNESDAGPERSR